MSKKIITAIIFCMQVCFLHAQLSFADTTMQTQLHANRVMYDKQRGSELGVYNGLQHYPYSATIEGIAYFRADEWKKGTVMFSDIFYEDIFMKYDLVMDQLIITPNDNGGLQIALYSPRVKEFTFGGNRFVRITKAESNGTLTTGFYQELAKGKVTAYARTEKTIEEKIEITGISRWFEQKTRYYILKDGKYQIIRSKGALMNVLKEHKKEVQQALSRSDLNYKKNAQQSIAIAVEAYNQSN